MFSPFAKLPATLPSSLHRTSSRRVVFPDDSGRFLAKDVHDLSGTGLARANSVIPNSLPSYYFEMTLIDLKADGEII
jgi:hypothetical protein